MRQLVNKACANDTRAFAVLADLARRAGLLESAPVDPPPPIDDRDLAAAAELLRVFTESEVESAQ